MLIKGIQNAAFLQGKVEELLSSRESARKMGAFFTSGEIKEKVKNYVPQGEEIKYVDPACGKGDLLLAIADLLEVKSTLLKTLQYWNTKLYGLEKEVIFYNMAIKNIHDLAIEKGSFKKGLSCPDEILTNIKNGDFYKEMPELSRDFCIVMNPPYGQVNQEQWYPFSKGKITEAALFLKKATDLIEDGGALVGIFPEVLRCGSRYENFDKYLGSKWNLEKLEKMGKFSSSADVDVFMAKAKKSNNNQVKRLFRNKSENIGERVSDYFEIKVGPVVPHRLKDKGKVYDYLYPGNVPKWGKIESIKDQIKFEGKVFNPPFVVIFRNSRPDDKKRAVAALCKSQNPVAVENHLFIAIPKRKNLSDCKNLMGLLNKGSTDDHLNDIMCCRHLTKKSIESIPWR